MFFFFIIYLQQKQFENEQALRYLGERFIYIDSLDDQSRLLELARGFLAGNVFDWGAKEVAAIMEKGEFSFGEAQSRLQGQWTWFVIELDRGFLTGYMFDWGAKEVVALMEKKSLALEKPRLNYKVSVHGLL